MNAGESKIVERAFPPTIRAGRRGKEAIFTITVHEIKKPELPALDDELRQAVSTNQTLDELKADLRRRLDGASRRAARAV